MPPYSLMKTAPWISLEATSAMPKVAKGLFLDPGLWSLPLRETYKLVCALPTAGHRKNANKTVVIILFFISWRSLLQKSDFFSHMELRSFYLLSQDFIKKLQSVAINNFFLHCTGITCLIRCLETILLWPSIPTV